MAKIHKGKAPHYYITEHMEVRGLTDQVVANRMGNARGTVWRYRHQPWKLKPPVLLGLAEAIFGHTDYLLFTRTPEPIFDKSPRFIARPVTSPREYREAFAERVKRAREHARLTQEDLARLLRISGPTLSKCEGGRGDDAPSLLSMHLIADFCLICRVRITWLLTGRGRMGQESDEAE